MITVSDISNIRYTNVLPIDSLVSEYPGWNWLTPARNVLYYSFSAPATEVPTSLNVMGGLTEFNVVQRSAALAQLAYITQLTGIRFELVADYSLADLRFANADLIGPGTIGLAELKRDYAADANDIITRYSGSAFVYLDNVEWAASTAVPIPGNRGYWGLLHELGHVLGLKHPFDGNPRLPSALDNKANTIMSYTESGAQPSTFSPFDVAALMWLYGDDGIGGALGATSTGKYLVGDATGNTLFGTSGGDKLEGLQGNDLLDGGSGIDTAVFGQDRSNYVGPLASGDTFSIWSTTGAEGTDTLRNIERVQFASSQLALDTTMNGAAGKAALLIGAVLGNAALSNATLVGELIAYFDNGHSLAAASDVLVNTGVMDALAGSTSNVAYVNLIYRAVMGHVASGDTTVELVTYISSGEYTKAGFLANVAELPFNQVNVDLVGLQQTGLVFV